MKSSLVRVPWVPCGAQVAELEVQMAEAESQKIDEASSCEDGVRWSAPATAAAPLEPLVVLGLNSRSAKFLEVSA